MLKYHLNSQFLVFCCSVILHWLMELMTDVKTKSGSKKAISVQYTLVNEEKSHLEFIEQAPAAKSGFLKINSGQHNISFQI